MDFLVSTAILGVLVYILIGYGIKKQFDLKLFAVILGSSLGIVYLPGCKDDPEPSPTLITLTQTVEVENYVDIKYNATLVNAKEANRKILFNGSLIDSRIIEAPSYSETLEDLIKGDYDFILEVDAQNRNVKRSKIRNYIPEARRNLLDSIQIDVDRHSYINFDFRNVFFDKNPEDNPVNLRGVKAFNELIQVTFVDGYDVTIRTRETSGTYQLELTYGSEEGGFGKTIMSGQILSGVLEDEEFLFYSRRNNNDDIYTMNTYGTKLNRLTTDPNQDLYPSWSPDYSKIVFHSNRDSDFALFTMDANGENQTRITNGFGFVHWPYWCLNDRIVFTYADSSKSEIGIALINPNGSGFTSVYKELIPSPIFSPPSNACCSPDGTQIAFTMKKDGRWNIFVINSDGSNLRNLTNDNPDGDFYPRWSPDGEKIVFSSNQAGSFDIYSISPDGSNVKLITNFPGFEGEPNFTYDSKRIIFMYGHQIYIINADGVGDLTQLTSLGLNFGPSLRKN